MQSVRTEDADPRRGLLIDLYRAALTGIEGRRAVRDALTAAGERGPCHLIAIGKAAVSMAEGALEALGADVLDGLVVTPPNAMATLPRMTVLAGDHPVPGAASLAAGAALESYIDRLPSDARVWVLVSGGGSALVETLTTGVTPTDLETLTRHALSHDVPITTLNAWRRRLSELKDGRLAARLGPRRAEALLMSDVPGDDPSLIASGLVAAGLDDTPPDTTALPAHLATLVRDARPVRRGARLPCRVVVSRDTALAAIETRALALGLTVERIAERLDGPTATVAGEFLRRLEASSADLVVGGGETTVRLPATPGRGGRAQHLALTLALALEGRDDRAVLVASTDGCDGDSPDAGALVDGGTVKRAADGGVPVSQALATATSGECLEASGDLLHTGPTGANVGDVCIGLRRASLGVAA